MSTTTPRAREEILKLAVVKAVKNGWNKTTCSVKEMDSALDVYGDKYLWDGLCSLIIKEDSKFYFDKDFARAFWGDEGCCLYCGKTKINDTGHCPVHDVIDFYDYPYPIWQYHRHKMLDENDPISYLEQFL